jgi:ParB family chromosome partitioning protein
VGGEFLKSEEDETMTMLENSDRRIEQWPLADLKPHSRQAEFFPPPDEREVMELAGDLEANGLLQPVEVLPDGTIVCGHKRVQAARMLGWPRISVWIRADLDAAGPAAVETRFLQDNVTRHQLSPLQLARCYQRLRELAKGVGRDGLADHDREDLRDVVGRKLKQSGRNLDRYLRVLKAPLEIQRAVAGGLLPVTVAERVAGLPRARREQVAREIAGGEDPREVVRRHVREMDRRRKGPAGALKDFVRCLERGVADLAGRVRDVGSMTRGQREALDAAQALIRDLQREADRRARERAAEEGPANLDEVLGALGVQAPADEAPPEPAPGGRRRGRKPRG